MRRQALHSSLALAALLSSLACQGELIEAETLVEPDPGPPPCGTGSGELPPGLTTLIWDNGEGVADITQQDWSVSGEPLAEAPLYEAVRFDLAHPARVYGFSVQWSNLPDPNEAEAEIFAGLYPDFGHNGFDFWPSPLWEGSRCREDVEEGGWVSYALPRPITFDHPGLVYVAHLRAGPGQPTFLFDVDHLGEGDCAAFADCHSALNLPYLQDETYYNGVSLMFPYDFMVRLHIRYLDDLLPEETFFQPLPVDAVVSKRHAFGDYDNDGDDDLLTGARLLRNDDGLFVDVTEAAGLVGASGGVWGDYDNDGCLDLFAFSASLRNGDRLWRGDCGGGFEEMTAVAGIDDVRDDMLCRDDPELNHLPTNAAAWWDLDSDGWLDLYLPNYICSLGDGAESYYPDQVFHNNGDGTFDEWTATHGFYSGRRAGRGAAPVDVEQDGDVDLLVNNYRIQANLFFDNQGDGQVQEVAIQRNLAGNADRIGQSYAYGHTIGTAWGDLDNDGDFDLIEANLAHPRFFHFSDKTRVLLNDGAGFFDDITGAWLEPESAAGLRFQEMHSVPVLADFDSDGVLDLAISATESGRPTDFYWGVGDGSFVLDAYHAGISVTGGWGMAAADWDRDGDLDLATDGVLFENRWPEPGHWLQVRAIGTERCNRGAYGATVRVLADEVTRVRHVQGGSGQGCQDSAFLHFGLGDSEQVELVEVDFPGAGTVRFQGPFAVDQRLWLYEDGELYTGWAPP